MDIQRTERPGAAAYRTGVSHRAPPMPAPTVPCVQTELAESARKHFQRRYAEPLNDDDGLEIATNLLGAFGILREWRDRRAAEGPALTPTPPRLAPKRARSIRPSTSPE